MAGIPSKSLLVVVGANYSQLLLKATTLGNIRKDALAILLCEILLSLVVAEERKVILTPPQRAPTDMNTRFTFCNYIPLIRQGIRLFAN